MKISEAIDYLRAVAPMQAVPIHQGAVAKGARSYYYDRLSEMTGRRENYRCGALSCASRWAAS